MPAHKIDAFPRYPREEAEGNSLGRTRLGDPPPQPHQRGNRQERVQHHHEHSDGQDEPELRQCLEAGGGQRGSSGRRRYDAEKDAESSGFEGAQHCIIQSPALGPFLRYAIEEMYDLVVSKPCQDGDKGQADEIYFSRIEACHARSPENTEAGG